MLSDGIPFDEECATCGATRGQHWTLPDGVHCYDPAELNTPAMNATYFKRKESYSTRASGESVCKCDIKDLLSSGHSSSCGYKR